MIYREFPPPPSLGEFVRSIYYQSGDMGSATISILPDFKTDIIFLHETTLTGEIGDAGKFIVNVPIVNGFRREPLRFSYNGHVEMLGIRFLPYGFTRLFGIPSGEITNIRPLAEMIGSRPVAELTEKIFTASDPEEKNRIVISWLLQTMAGADIYPSLPIRAINRISSTRGAVPLLQICNNSPSEYKQLQRFCHKNLDICPKYLSRMIRFEDLHQNLRNPGRADWLSLVHSSGFTDQSHLIREVRQFTGLSPREFLASIETYL